MISAPVGAIWRIGQLAAAAGVRPKTIRFYEEAGLLPLPSRSAAGYRLYGQEDLERLLFLRRAKALGLSLDAIRQVLAIRDGGESPCSHVKDLLEEKLREVREHLDTLRELEAELKSLRAVAGRVDPKMELGRGYCCILEQLEAGRAADRRRSASSAPPRSRMLSGRQRG